MIYFGNQKNSWCQYTACPCKLKILLFIPLRKTCVSTCNNILIIDDFYGTKWFWDKGQKGNNYLTPQVIKHMSVV